MYPVSTEFKRAVRKSHVAITRAEVWSGDTKIMDLEPLSGSSVSIDSRRAVRRTCTLNLASPLPTTAVVAGPGPTYAEIALAYATYALLDAAFPTYKAITYTGSPVTVTVDNGIVPDNAFGPLAPFGNEIRLWRGLSVTKSAPLYYASLSNGQLYSTLDAGYATYAILAQSQATYVDDEMVPLGVFEITDVQIKDGSGGVQLTVNGSDRSIRISRSRWTQPYAITSGTDLATGLTALLSNRWDDIDFRFPTTPETMNQAVLGTSSDNDPWRDAVGIAAALGYQLYFDGDGFAVLAAIRDYTAASPDAAYQQDVDAMVLDVTRDLTNSETYNGCIVTGEGTGNADAYRGEAWDTDPTSPTYIYGKFGLVPFFYSSPLISSAAQALATATALLNSKRGATENVQWTQVVDPSLDGGDVIALTNAGTKLDRLLVLDRVTIPLDAANAINAVARTVRSLNGETFLDTSVA